MNPEQHAAVHAEGEVFVSAGAGTGKTTVLVERFVRAVCEEGLDVESVLVITYTRKAAGAQRRADPGPELSGRLARVRDDEDRLDVEALLAHRAHEALDEHRRLAGAGTRRHEHLAARLDCRALVGIHDRLTRHIDQRSHHDGHAPPFGSCRTSPARMRCA